MNSAPLIPPAPSPELSREQSCELLRGQLSLALKENNLEQAKSLLLPVQPVDIAEVIGELPEAQQALAFRLLPKDLAIRVYEHLDIELQQTLLREFRSQEIQDILDKMSPDDRARLFDELPAKVVAELLPQLSPEEREATALLLGYAPNTAGRIMTPEYISLRENLTAAEALERVRLLARETETIYYLYVTDQERHLTGTLSLRELVMADPAQRLEEVMNREVVFVSTHTDQEEVARVIQRYDLLAVPVVDAERRLVGIVTVDDVLDILEQEATEDIYSLGGLQSGEEDYFDLSFWQAARKRVVWLLILLFTNTFTSTIIAGQEEVLSQVIALAAFIPLLVDSGGNVGSQSSTVVIRGLSTATVRLKDGFGVLAREAAVGAMLGIMLSLITIGWAYALQRDLLVAIIVGLSLFGISVLSSVSGAGLPFLFRSFGFDPALMATPFITTIVDVLGVLIYFSVARLILGI
ncbi:MULTISPECIES: magnesium transporter [unclassified Synechococcus]|uniref:magnesium transporter n=1 Tax=unclassified Synechococcus TaxID=2626047 RepID=UPI0039C4257C